MAEAGQAEAEQLGALPDVVPRILRRLSKLVGGDVSGLRVCYEAGSTGFGLGRRSGCASAEPYRPPRPSSIVTPATTADNPDSTESPGIPRDKDTPGMKD